MHRSVLSLLLLTACGLPLVHAPPRPVRHTALVPPPAADSEVMVIAMTHGTCFGRCPAYTYSFARNGRAIREGIAFVTFPQCSEGQLPAGAFDDLARRLISSGYFGRDSLVGPAMTDVPYLSIAVQLRDGRGHAVSGAMDPPELLPISTAMDSLGALVHWDSVPAVRLHRRDQVCPWGVGDVRHE